MDSGVDVSALSGLRIGCVQYLNSRPLIHGLERVRLAHPSTLAAELREGQLDAALVPVVEWLRSPESYVAVDGFGIASRGPVMSVFLAHQGRVEEVGAIVADPASLTSVHLVQVLIRGVLGRRIPVLASATDCVGFKGGFAQLWIGNQALRHRMGSAGKGFEYWDLGEVWTRWTGLPFVYAVWVMRPGLQNLLGVAATLRGIARDGIRSLESILAQQRELPMEIAREYLTERICFSIGEAEKLGLERFREELETDGFLPKGLGGFPLRWV